MQRVMNGGVEAASKGLKGQFRSHFAELRLHQRWDQDGEGAGEGLGRCGSGYGWGGFEEVWQ